VQQQTQQTLASQELDRAQTLLKQGYATQELFDQQKQALDGANAGLIAAKERVEEAKHALEALQHDVGSIRSILRTIACRTSPAAFNIVS